MRLDSSNIRIFNDLGEAFMKQYKYNMFMAPDHDQLRAMARKDKELFKEYTQHWHEITSQVVPPMGEQEMTKVFLKTLGSFCYERMVTSAPSDFTEMVSMGVRLEEVVREGNLTKDEGIKKSSYMFSRKKESETNVVIRERKIRPPRGHHRYQQQVASVTPVINVALTTVAYQRPYP